MQAVSCGVCGGLIEHESRPYRSPEQMSKKRKTDGGKGDNAIVYPMHDSLLQASQENRPPLGAYYIVSQSSDDQASASDVVRQTLPMQGPVRVAFTPQLARIRNKTYFDQTKHHIGQTHLFLTYAGFIDVFAFAPVDLCRSPIRLLEGLNDDLALFAGREDGWVVVGERGEGRALADHLVVPIELDQKSLVVTQVHPLKAKRWLPREPGADQDSDTDHSLSSDDDDDEDDLCNHVLSWPNDENCPDNYEAVHLVVSVKKTKVQIELFFSF